MATNPDVLRTIAFTDTSAAALEPVADAIPLDSLERLVDALAETADAVT